MPCALFRRFGRDLIDEASHESHFAYDLLQRVAAALDEVHTFRDLLAGRRHQVADRAGGFRRALREMAHFGRDDGKTGARGARRALLRHLH